jgi:hypothetical protein
VSGEAPLTTAPKGEPASAEAAGRPSPEWQWYGWKIAVADVVPLTLLTLRAAGKAETAPVGVVGGLLFAFATPFIHGLEERPGRLPGSVAMRIGAVLFYGGLLSNAENCNGDVQPIGTSQGCPRQTVTVMLAPLLVAAIDSLAMGWTHEPHAPMHALWVAPTAGGMAMGGTW